MGVYINMEMPKSCGQCKLKTVVGLDKEKCLVSGIEFYSWDTGWGDEQRRHESCPLVPVPPHGDLIDRKPFVEFIKTHWDSYDQWFVDQLEARPTVIPADPAEEGET